MKAGKRLLISLVSAILLVTGLAITAQPVQACSCVMNLDPVSELNRSSAVFSGKVLQIGEERLASGDQLKKALIEVDQIWKGIDQTQMWVYTAYGGEAACGIEFVEGESYLMYTRADEGGRLNASFCSRTTTIQSATDDLQALGTGTAPEREVDLSGQSAASPIDQSLVIIAAGLIIVAIAGGGYLLLIKRRTKV